MTALPTTAHALWITGPKAAALRSEPLEHRAGQVLVQASFSAVSRGTERLVFEGRVGPELHATMRCPHQAGEFTFPVKYGYCAVGRVIDGPAELLGRNVFCLHPHQDFFSVSPASVLPVPSSVPARRAVLAANLETAVNALWDSGIGPGYRVAVVGAGTIGTLVGYLASQIPGVELEMLEVVPERRQACHSLGLPVAEPDQARRQCDVVFHTSGHPSGLTAALNLVGFEGRVIELSWYGNADVPVPLGGRFHSERLQIISSQVGQVSAGLRARWTHARRLELALRLLADSRYDTLLGAPIPFRRLPEALANVLQPQASVSTPVVDYSFGHDPGSPGTGES